MAKNSRIADTELRAFEKAAQVCACANIRKLSRAVTQLFDQSLEPSGLRSTQLIILLEIAVARSATVPGLARRLVMDRSTLTRNLGPLVKRGLLKIDAIEGGRGQSYALGPKGMKALKAAVPLWEGAQARFVETLGDRQWRALVAGLSAAVNAARR